MNAPSAAFELRLARSRVNEVLAGLPASLPYASQEPFAGALIVLDRLAPAEARAARLKLRLPVTESARALHSRDIRPLESVVEGLLPEGAHLLAGKPKVGKSWFCLQLAVAVAEGDSFLGRKVRGGDVLYLALEDSDRRLKERLSRLLPDLEGAWPARLHFATDWPRFGEGAEEQLAKWLAAHPETRLIIGDTWAKLRPRRERDEGVYDSDYRAGNSLGAVVSSRPGLTALAVHHMRKAAADDPLESVSGSHGLTGGVDGALLLERVRSDRQATLRVVSRDLDCPDLGIEFDRDSCLWRVIGTAEEVRASAERRRVLAVLRDAGGPMLPRDVAAEAGLSRTSVRHLLRRMLADGLVRRIEGRSSQHRYEAA